MCSRDPTRWKKKAEGEEERTGREWSKGREEGIAVSTKKSWPVLAWVGQSRTLIRNDLDERDAEKSVWWSFHFATCLQGDYRVKTTVGRPRANGET